jgi:hypothetical protein
MAVATSSTPDATYLIPDFLASPPVFFGEPVF